MAYDAFLKLDGINGESQKKDHTNEIDIMSFSWGASNSTSVGTGTGPSTGKVSVSDFSIMKSTDSSSPLLFQKCCDGTVIASAQVTLQKSAGTSPIQYLIYKFTNVYITSLQWSGSGGAGDTPMESVSFCFETGTVDYTPQADTGSGTGTVHGGWDIGQNTSA
ncbi:MAG TPA: type VI secretion system tube protein Hcp [Terriglobia bacterium]|nr:type VI secretion system tube protein Hcp [Terriglobia bacterium]